MVQTAPDARPHLSIITLVDRVSTCDSPCCRETEFQGGRQLGRKRRQATLGLAGDLNPSRGARQCAAIRPPRGNLWWRANAWWAREDSNLQPSGYEPLALTIELRARAAGVRASVTLHYMIVAASQRVRPELSGHATTESALPAQKEHSLLGEQIPKPPRHLQAHAPAPSV
jgi:hypothetical protein